MKILNIQILIYIYVRTLFHKKIHKFENDFNENFYVYET